MRRVTGTDISIDSLSTTRINRKRGAQVYQVDVCCQYRLLRLFVTERAMRRVTTVDLNQ